MSGVSDLTSLDITTIRNGLLNKEFSATEFEDHLDRRPFIKLAKKTSLSNWDNAIQILSNEFVEIIKWLN